SSMRASSLTILAGTFSPRSEFRSMTGMIQTIPAPRHPPPPLSPPPRELVSCMRLARQAYVSCNRVILAGSTGHAGAVGRAGVVGELRQRHLQVARSAAGERRPDRIGGGRGDRDVMRYAESVRPRSTRSCESDERILDRDAVPHVDLEQLGRTQVRIRKGFAAVPGIPRDDHLEDPVRERGDARLG